MENYVQLTLSDGLHVRVNKEKIPESIVGSSFVHILTVIGTSERYYYRCVDEVLDDPANLKADIEEYLRTAPHLVHDAPVSKFQGRHDFSYGGILTEIFWSAADLNNMVEVKVYYGVVDVPPYRLSHAVIDNKVELVRSAVKAILMAKRPITDAEFEPEDLTMQFIRACQNEFGTNGEITTITVNTKTKEITVTAQIEHKLYL